MRPGRSWKIGKSPMLLPGSFKENFMHYNQTYNKAPARLAVLDIETLAPAQLNGTFPPWPLHRPLVASVLMADQAEYGQWQVAIESVEFCDERAAVIRIDELLDCRRTITFNGKGFDLSVLSMAVFRASAYECRNLTDAWASPRFGGSHIDVAELITNFGAAPRASLEMLCEAAQIPSKQNGHGGDVAEMLRDHCMEAVKRYCEEDVGSTLVLFAMVQALRANDPAYAASLIADFANWVGDAGLDHLDEFQKLSGNATLERVRLLHRVDEGLRALGDRVTNRHFAEQARSAPKSRQSTVG